MNTTSCEQLDGYLADWLSGDERSEFEAHLAGCQHCQTNAEQQRRIDRLLARGVERLEPMPTSLVSSIESRIDLYRRRAMQVACGISSGVVLAILFGVWATRDSEPVTQRRIEPKVVVEHGSPAASKASPTDRPVQVTLTDRSAAILVPGNTDTPNVTIFRVYPTLKRARVSSMHEVN